MNPREQFVPPAYGSTTAPAPATTTTTATGDQPKGQWQANFVSSPQQAGTENSSGKSSPFVMQGGPNPPFSSPQASANSGANWQMPRITADGKPLYFDWSSGGYQGSQVSLPAPWQIPFSASTSPTAPAQQTQQQQQSNNTAGAGEVSSTPQQMPQYQNSQIFSSNGQITGGVGGGTESIGQLSPDVAYGFSQPTLSNNAGVVQGGTPSNPGHPPLPSGSSTPQYFFQSLQGTPIPMTSGNVAPVMQSQPQPQAQPQPQGQQQVQTQRQHQVQPQGQYQMQPQGQHQVQLQGQHQMQPPAHPQVQHQTQSQVQHQPQQPLQPQFQAQLHQQFQPQSQPPAQPQTLVQMQAKMLSLSQPQGQTQPQAQQKLNPRVESQPPAQPQAQPHLQPLLQQQLQMHEQLQQQLQQLQLQLQQIQPQLQAHQQPQVHGGSVFALRPSQPTVSSQVLAQGQSALEISPTLRRIPNTFCALSAPGIAGAGNLPTPLLPTLANGVGSNGPQLCKKSVTGSASPSSPSIVPTVSVGRFGLDKSKRKTKICHHWMSYGQCGWGDECAFAHGELELYGNSGSIVSMTADNSSETSNHQNPLHSGFSHCQPMAPEGSPATKSNCSSSHDTSLNSAAGTTTGSRASFSGLQASPLVPNPSPVTTSRHSPSSSVENFAALPDCQGIPTTTAPADTVQFIGEATFTAGITNQPESAYSFPLTMSSSDPLNAEEMVSDDASGSSGTSTAHFS